MMLWPWQSLRKKLNSRIEECKLEDCKRYTPEEFFIKMRNKPKIPFYQVWLIRTEFFLKETAWFIYRIFDPCNERVRKIIPRKWTGSDELIRILNFEILLQFYEEEYTDALVEFDTEFVFWIEDAYTYLKSGRDEIQHKIQAEFDRVDGLPYAENRYQLVWQLEKEIEEKDTDLLINLIKYRGHFWT